MAENQKKFINNITIKGVLAENNLEIKTTKTGKEYITGTIVVKTGENSLHKLKVNTYKLKKDGTVNSMFTGLVTVMETHKSIAKHGDEADAVEVKAKLDIEDYKGRDGQMVKYVSKVVSSCSRISKETLEPEAKGTLHIIIDRALMEVNKEGEETGRATVKGYCMQYTGAIFPVDFKIENPKGVERIMQSDIEKATVIQAGIQLVNSTEKIERVTEYDFGEPEVDTFEKVVNEIVITGLKIAEEKLQFTVEEFNKALTERQIMLDEKMNEKKETAPTQTTTKAKATAVADDFDF